MSALQRHCAAVGRDYGAIQQVVRVGILIGESEREVERITARPDTRPLRDIHLVGTPAQVTEALLAVVARGAHQLTVNFADVPRPEGTWLFAATVLPHLRAVPFAFTNPLWVERARPGAARGPGPRTPPRR
jgi:alkanesulfonate monooxygenase SsuD/methylene tetrahydromethanopterin reductase-like flavin-dependent oxidoreductase (luciferase family)